MATNNFSNLSFENSSFVDIPCSVGTTGPNCESCSQGYYFESDSCIPCPKGTFNDKTGLITKNQCVPCKYGMYSDNEGSKMCKECPTGTICPIGSINYLNEFSLAPNKSTQPQKYSSKDNISDQIMQLLMFLVPSFFLLVIFTGIKFKGCRNYIEKIDLFIDGHSQEIGVPIVHKKTLIGGVFTLNFYFFTIFSIIAASIAYSLGNTYEIRALIPVAILENR